MTRNEIIKNINKYINTQKININLVDNITKVENISEHLKTFNTDMFNAQFMDIKGAVFNNQVYIFSDFINSEDELIETLNHEIAGHFSFSKIFTENQRKNILTKIYIDLEENDQNYIKKFYENKNKYELAEEFLCFSIEKMESNTKYPFLNSILKKNIDYFKQNFLKNNKRKKELRI